MLGQYSHSLKLPFDKLYASFAANLHTEQVPYTFTTFSSPSLNTETLLWALFCSPLVTLPL